MKRPTVLNVVATLVTMIVTALPGAASASVGEGGSARIHTAPGDPALHTADTRAGVVPRQTFDEVAARARADGSVRVIVGLRAKFTPEGLLEPAAATRQRNSIRSAQETLLTAIRASGATVHHRYDTLPFLAVTAPTKTVEALRNSDAVASLQVDSVAEPSLASTTKLVEAAESASLGHTGAGQTIAILDTGVDRLHPFLAARVVDEACFSGPGECPDGTAEQTGPGSSAPCAIAVLCDHGTHVAGIAAGRRTTGTFDGTAPGADLLSVNVFHRSTCVRPDLSVFPCPGSFASDQIKGLEWVFAQRNNRRIAAVNLSLGSPTTQPGPCDATEPGRTAAINQLRSVDVATVISAGNSGDPLGLSSPACISTAVSVGSSTLADAVSSTSNGHRTQLALYAPGDAVTSSVPGGGFAQMGGTSMAAPQVAGAWAILKQQLVNARVDQILTRLQNTGVPIVDARTNPPTVAPRIRVLAALASTGMFSYRESYRNTFVRGGVVSNGAGLASRNGGPSSAAVAISGIPRFGGVQKAFLYWATVGGPDPTITLNGQTATGTLIGAAPDTANPLRGANRVYRADVTSLVSGNGLYQVGGVSTAYPTDGQGASLVVVWANVSPIQATQNRTTVVLVDGARASVGASNLAVELDGLWVPSAVRGAVLHVGMGDGDAGAEGAMELNGHAVTAPNFFTGSDGPSWDDNTITVPDTLLPAGAGYLLNSVQTTGDSLLWAYSALEYSYDRPICCLP